MATTKKVATTKVATTKVSDQVRQVLANLQWMDGACMITVQLDRKLYTAVNTVLEAAGGKWNKKAKRHLFDCDGEDAVREIVRTGEYVNEKKTYQIFDTPTSLADEIVQKFFAAVPTTSKILEPSAGIGRLVEALQKRNFTNITAVEAVLGRAEKVRELGVPTTAKDFLTLVPEKLGKFDAVIMNPPFTRGQDVEHVCHATTFVRSGGMLVAIMSPGWQFRSDRRSTEFRTWLHSQADLEIEEIPEGVFAESGTNVRTVLVRFTVE